jgi:acetyl esterase/lipase
MGDSAGGNLALIAAYGPGTASVASSCGGDAVTPAGVIAVAPSVDLGEFWSAASVPGGAPSFPEVYTGGTPSEFPDRYAAASPLRLIRPGLPPTLLIAGSIDHVVHLTSVEDFAKRLGAVGVDCSLVVIPYADHGFDGVPNAYAGQIVEGVVAAFIASRSGGAAWSGGSCA